MRESHPPKPSDPAPLPANAATPESPAVRDQPDQRRPIQCGCGRKLLIRVARDGVVLRCPEHGIQFRYMTDC